MAYLVKGGDCYAVPSSSSDVPRSASVPSRRASSSSWSASASYWVPNVRCLEPWLGPGRVAFPCGRCLPCRLNRRRIWTHRIMLEAMQHADSSFVTLTYRSEEAVELVPDDVSGWIKRLRARVAPGRIRFFAVGEYGDRSWRPHYHAAVFGFPSCQGGPRVSSLKGGYLCQCASCSVVRETWPYGNVLVGTLEERSAQYIAGYVVKKLSQKSDPRLEGRHPEFARMSLRPGIGAGAIPDVASVLMQYRLMDTRLKDVPVALRHGKKELPLGRYLRRELRRQVGLDEKAPEHVIEALRQGLLPVFEAAFVLAPGLHSAPVRKALVEDAVRRANEQGARNLAARSQMYRRSL